MGRPALVVGDGLDVSQPLTPNDPSQSGRWADAGQLSSVVHALVVSLPMAAFHGAPRPPSRSSPRELKTRCAVRAGRAPTRSVAIVNSDLA